MLKLPFKCRKSTCTAEERPSLKPHLFLLVTLTCHRLSFEGVCSDYILLEFQRFLLSMIEALVTLPEVEVPDKD